MAALPFTSIERIGTRLWRYSWTGTGPFTVFVAGRLHTTNLAALYIDVSGYSNQEPYEIEVREPNTVTETETNTPRAALQWWGNPDAAYYNIYNGAVHIDSVGEYGTGYCSWVSDPLDDQTVYDFDVRQVDSAGNESAITQLTVAMVRNPVPPLVIYSYDAETLTFTVAAIPVVAPVIPEF